jgi:hypothetical protein
MINVSRWTSHWCIFLKKIVSVKPNNMIQYVQVRFGVGIYIKTTVSNKISSLWWWPNPAAACHECRDAALLRAASLPSEVVLTILEWNREGRGASYSGEPQEAKYVEGWPDTTSAWAGWSRFDIPVDRCGGVHSLLRWPSRTLRSLTCH